MVLILFETHSYDFLIYSTFLVFELIFAKIRIYIDTLVLMVLLIIVNQLCYNRRENKELKDKLIIKENLLADKEKLPADKENLLAVKDAEIQQLR